MYGGTVGLCCIDNYTRARANTHTHTQAHTGCSRMGSQVLKGNKTERNKLQKNFTFSNSTYNLVFSH